MGVKFGIFDHLERRRDVPLDHQYRDRLEWVVQAEQAGFHCYHVAAVSGSEPGGLPGPRMKKLRRRVPWCSLPRN